MAVTNPISKRDRKRKHYMKLPLIKRIGQNLERINKRLTLRLLGRVLRTRRLHGPLSLDQIESVLILRYDALGDMVLTTPLWRTLKAQKPSLKIGVAASIRNRNIIESDPDIDEVYLFSRQTTNAMMREIRRARETQWDLVIHLVYIEKTRGAIVSALAAPRAFRVTNVRDKKHLYNHLYSRLGDRPPLKPPTPMIEQVIQTMQTGIDIDINNTIHPSLHIDQTILHTVTEEIKRTIESSGSSRYIVLNTEAASESREWGFENSITLTKQLLDRFTDLYVLWTSSPHRAELTENFLNSHSLTRAGYYKTNSQQHVAAVIHGADLVISPDTSIIHIASAERKPVLGFYMESNEFLPYQVSCSVLFAEPGKPMSSIPVNEAFSSVVELITTSA